MILERAGRGIGQMLLTFEEGVLCAGEGSDEDAPGKAEGDAGVWDESGGVAAGAICCGAGDADAIG